MRCVEEGVRDICGGRGRLGEEAEIRCVGGGGRDDGGRVSDVEGEVSE